LLTVLPFIYSKTLTHLTLHGRSLVRISARHSRGTLRWGTTKKDKWRGPPYINSNPGGIDRKKTSKRVKIHYKVVITRIIMKKLCNPHLISCYYFDLSTFPLKISFYISFCNASDKKLDYGRLFSLPQEAIWMMQHLKKNLMLCLWDGCKAIWTAGPRSHSFSVANTHQEFLDSFSKLDFLHF